MDSTILIMEINTCHEQLYLIVLYSSSTTRYECSGGMEGLCQEETKIIYTVEQLSTSTFQVSNSKILQMTAQTKVKNSEICPAGSTLNLNNYS